jgi:hypothetical protein
VSFASKLKKSIEDQPDMGWTPRPEVLLLPQIPKPLHGVAPRAILGSTWWNQTRQAAYKSTDFHCIACKVHKTKARGRKHLEAHEIYRTDYAVGRTYYVEAVPLCNYCHSFIHIGRLEALLKRGQITQQRYASVIQHGERVLALAGLIKPPPHEGPHVPWSKWRLVLNGKMYRPIYRSEEEWLKHFDVVKEDDA